MFYFVLSLLILDLEGDQSPVERDQMGQGSYIGGSSVPASVSEVGKGSKGPGEEAGSGEKVLPEHGGFSSQGLSCSLCKRLFSSLEHLREHEYHHTLSLMALSLDWPGMPGPLHQPIQPRHQSQPQPPLFSQSLYRPAVGEPVAARYFCSHCPASFTLKSNADRHEKTIHFKKKLMQCVYCLKHFRDRTDLHRHLSSVHSKERGHTCPACAKAFSTQKNLATHVKVCCQVALVPGALLGGSTGMEMSQSGPSDPLWRLNQHLKVDSYDGSIDVEGL